MVLRFLLNDALMLVIWHFNIVDFLDENANFAQKIRDFNPQVAESLRNLLLEFNCAIVFPAHVLNKFNYFFYFWCLLNKNWINSIRKLHLSILGSRILTVEINSGSICASAWSKPFRNFTFVFSANPRSRKRTVASEIMRCRPPGRMTRIEASSNLQPCSDIKTCLTFDQLASLRSIRTAYGAAEFELQILL